MLSPTGHISRCDPKRSYMKVSLGFRFEAFLARKVGWSVKIL